VAARGADAAGPWNARPNGLLPVSERRSSGCSPPHPSLDAPYGWCGGFCMGLIAPLVTLGYYTKV
jgi:hypothetical protein